MPDFGLLERSDIIGVPLGGEAPAPWRLAGARVAQLTFEVEKKEVLATLPPEVSRPTPCYARLFVLEAAEGPFGPFSMAALLIGGRYAMTPRNVVVQNVVYGPSEAVVDAFGGPVVAGWVSLERTGLDVRAAVSVNDEEVASLVLPELHAIDPAMLRWDGWLGYAAGDGAPELIAYGPETEIREAFLSKRGLLETPTELPRGHAWRRFRNLNTISACYVEGTVTLGAPQVQQRLV